MIITNYKGDIIPFEGVKHEALKQDLNINCTNCTNCSNCINCSYCLNCTNCSYCTSQPIANIITPIWIICLRINTLKIGCQDHSIDSWFNFSDSEINLMHDDALKFWVKWKPIIKTLSITKSEFPGEKISK